jgi:opacity protein-like surface antigen
VQQATRFLSALILAGLAAATVEAADVRFGPQASYGLGSDEGDAGLGIGGRAVFDLARKRPGLGAVASADYFLSPEGGATGDGVKIDVSYLELNANLTHTFEKKARRVKKKGQAEPLLPYVGAGLNLAHRSASIETGSVKTSSSKTKVGLNVLGGLKVNRNVFGEVRYELGGGKQLVVTGGYVF